MSEDTLGADAALSVQQLFQVLGAKGQKGQVPGEFAGAEGQGPKEGAV